MPITSKETLQANARLLQNEIVVFIEDSVKTYMHINPMMLKENDLMGKMVYYKHMLHSLTETVLEALLIATMNDAMKEGKDEIF